MARVFIVAGLPESLVNFRGALIESLLSRGHMVSVACPPPGNTTLLWLSKRGVKCHVTPIARASISPFRDLKTLCRLHQIFRAERPDVVLSYTAKPVVYGGLAAWIAGVPRRYALITGLGYAFTSGTWSLNRFVSKIASCVLYAISLRTATAVFFQNEDDMALLRRIHVVPKSTVTSILNGSGVDLSKFSVAPLPRSTIFLMVARLIADKGVKEFIDAGRIVKAAFPSATFHLVGPVDSNPTSLPPTLIPQAVADGTIVYYGATSDVRPFIAASLVFVLPSYREGTSRTVLESMSMGRAIITTDAPGCRNTVAEGVNGFLVPIRNSHKLAAAMRRFVEFPNLAAEMGLRSREICAEKFDVTKVNDSLLSTMGLGRETCH